MKQIFFDFDDVLFDTRRFKRAHVDVFVRAGIPEALYMETYELARERSGALNYQFETHLEILREHVDYNEQALRDALADLTAHAYQFVFDDVVEGLQILTDRGYMLYLVTFGTPGWQDQKVAGSGIQGFFAEVVVGEIDKGVEIATRIGVDVSRVWFVDDRAEYLLQAESASHAVRSILMQRPEGRFSDVGSVHIDHTAHSLADVIAIVEEMV